MKTSIHLTVALVTLFGQILTSAAPRYSVTELPGAPGGDFRPWAINNRGEIVGHINFDDGPFDDLNHAAIYRDGASIDVHLLLGWGTNENSRFQDLNDRGEAILYGEYASFIYRNGELEELPQPPENSFFEWVAINSKGWITGTFGERLGNERLQAFLNKHGTLEWLGLPGVMSGAGDINDRGEVVGVHGGDGVIFFRDRIQVLEGISRPWRINNHGDILAFDDRPAYGAGFVRYKNGQVVELPFVPVAINDDRQIVGSKTVFDSDLNSHGMVHVEGVTYDLNEVLEPRTAKIIYAYDINRRGQIAAWGRARSGFSGLLLTPVR